MKVTDLSMAENLTIRDSLKKVAEMNKQIRELETKRNAILDPLVRAYSKELIDQLWLVR